MRAVVIARPGGPEVLELRDVPRPEPSRGEARVRVRAAGVNRADLLQRMGSYPAPPGAPADIPGLELAGEVEALGDGATEVAVGDRVMGVVQGGAYAEHVVTHARTLVPMPAGASFREAAAVPEAFLTAFDAFTQARLAPGDVALVHAAGSGVGTAAVQLASALGATVVGTARTKEKLERAAALGLLRGVVAEGGKFAEAVLAATGGRGVDVVLELVGGAYVAEDLRCVAPRARIVVVGLLAGAAAELDLATLLRKRASVTGTVLRSRPLEERIEAAAALRRLVPLFESGRLRPVVDRALTLDEAPAAHALLARNAGFGKLVLDV